MRIVERTVLAVLLAATLATLLLVARNGLAPVQHPVSFGVVLWAWVLLFYSAVGLGALLLAGLASTLPGLGSLPRWLLFGATAVFTAVALVSNPRAVSAVFTLSGSGLSSLLLPASAVLCALALVAVGAPLACCAAWVRAAALIGVAGGLLALAPHGERRETAVRTSASARIQGQRFVLVGVDGADWSLMAPLLERGELPHFKALKERGAWGSLETLRPTLSPAIWTSMVTGVLPRRHGVRDFATWHLGGVEETMPVLTPLRQLGFSFLFARLEAAGQMFQAPISSFTRRTPAFWNVATARGSPLSVINWWGTFPAEPVLGYMISERAYHHLTERSRRLYGVAGDMLVMFRLVDQTSHEALAYSELVEDHVGASSDDLRRYGGVVSGAYRAADAALGRIEEAFGAGNLIVVSDHGFKLDGGGYNHTNAPPGVFIAAGPAFRPGRVDGLSVLDVAPLLLYLKGFPLAEDVDGRLPVHALDPELLASKPPLRIASYGNDPRRGGPRPKGASAVDAEMLERLRALGYLR